MRSRCCLWKSAEQAAAAVAVAAGYYEMTTMANRPETLLPPLLNVSLLESPPRFLRLADLQSTESCGPERREERLQRDGWTRMSSREMSEKCAS